MGQGLRTSGARPPRVSELGAPWLCQGPPGWAPFPQRPRGTRPRRAGELGLRLQPGEACTERDTEARTCRPAQGRAAREPCRPRSPHFLTPPSCPDPPPPLLCLQHPPLPASALGPPLTSCPKGQRLRATPDPGPLWLPVRETQPRAWHSPSFVPGTMGSGAWGQGGHVCSWGTRPAEPLWRAEGKLRPQGWIQSPGGSLPS